MKIRYAITNELRQQVFIRTGYYPEKNTEFEFSTTELSVAAREKLVKMNADLEYLTYYPFVVLHGAIYEDGSVESTAPIVTSKSWEYTEMGFFVSNISDVEKVINDMYLDFEAKEAELKEYYPQWEKALAKYKAEKTEQEKRHEAIKEAEKMMQPEICALKKRIAELEGYLIKLIRHADTNALEAAGLVQSQSEQEEQIEELPQEVQEALRTAGIDDC